MRSKSMKKCLIGVYNRSVVLTYLGVVAAVYGMTICNSLKIAVCCLIVAGVCDLFDGKVASMCDRTERQKEFGIQIDSLADTVSFVVFPVMICGRFICTENDLTDPMTWAFFAAAVLYILAGIIRLGWFNVVSKEEKGVFYGLPVTAIALIFPLYYFVFGFMKQCPNAISATILLAVVAVLFVTNFKFKKPGKTWYFIATTVAIIAIVLLLACTKKS